MKAEKRKTEVIAVQPSLPSSAFQPSTFTTHPAAFRFYASILLVGSTIKRFRPSPGITNLQPQPDQQIIQD
jgi:hypothetical protein